MEHRLAQERMLICAAFFSFGAFSGAMTVYRLSETAAIRVFSEVCGFFSSQLMLRIPAAAVVMILLMMLRSPGAVGACTVCFFLSDFGFLGGFLDGLAIRAGRFSILSCAFLVPFSVCLLQIGCCMLRKSSVDRTRRSCGGLRKPDLAYDSAPMAGAAAVLILTALAFAYYLKSC